MLFKQYSVNYPIVQVIKIIIRYSSHLGFMVELPLFTLIR